MFEVEIKLKGDTLSYLSKFAIFRINGGNYTIDNEKSLIALIDNYEPEQIYMKHKEKYYPIHNCYYKAKQDVYLLEDYEGVDDGN